MDWADGMGHVSAVADTRLFSIGDTPITMATLAAVLLICLFTFIGSRLLQSTLRRALLARRVNEGTVGLIVSLVNYLFLALGLAVALETAGISVASLFAAGALFAVGVGFAMQSITQNFVSGVILLSERTIRPGDILEVDDRMVRVLRIGIRSTVVITRDGENLIVPNSSIVQSSVKNLTLDDSCLRLRVRVGVTYGSDMRLVRQTLERAVEALPWRVADKPSKVFMHEFGDNAVVFEVAVWMDSPWDAKPRASELHEAIWGAFKEHDITIAFPQLDVHFDSPADA